MDSRRKSPFLRALYDDACASDSERFTTKFFQYLFNRHIFTGDEWVVSSQQSPDLQNDRFVDLVVEKFHEDGRRTAMLFMKAKHPYIGPADVQVVESQVITAGQRYCASYEIDRVWVISCVGPKIRAWVHSAETQWLLPAYPTTTEMGNPSLYIDVIQDKTAFKYLKFIKRNPVPPYELVHELSLKFNEYDVAEGAKAWSHNLDYLMEEDAHMPGPSYNVSDDTIAGPSQQLQAFDMATAEQNPPVRPVKVSVRKVRHITEPSEYLFEANGKERSTSKDDWEERTYKGKTAWFYSYKDVIYYTRSLG